MINYFTPVNNKKNDHHIILFFVKDKNIFYLILSLVNLLLLEKYINKNYYYIYNIYFIYFS